MALIDILETDGKPAEYSLSRGNIGSVTEIVSRWYNEFKIPEGAGAGAVFPAVGDVESPVTYGPTGADYTGTLVQPLVADVELGVQYGAGGTEFTGTLVAGEEEYLIID